MKPLPIVCGTASPAWLLLQCTEICSVFNVTLTIMLKNHAGKKVATTIPLYIAQLIFVRDYLESLKTLNILCYFVNFAFQTIIR